MNDKNDFRNELYRKYLERPDESLNVTGYVPCPIRDDFGNALYGHAVHSLPRDTSVVELGAGEGHFLQYLKRNGFNNLRGVDLSEPLVAAAQKNGINVSLANAVELVSSLPDQSVGAFIAIDLIEHLTKPEIIDLLFHCFRCLPPGGLILLQTVNGQGLFPGQVMFGDATHVSILNPGSMGQILTAVGFTDLHFRESVCFGPGLRAQFRRFLWWLIKWWANFCRWAEAGKRQDIWSENMICCARKPDRKPD